MKTISPPPLICTFILILILGSRIKAQPSDYIIINKTNCAAQVTASCTGNTSASTILAPDEEWPNSCPAGETLCTVSMALPGPVNIFVGEYSLPCLNPGMDILPPSTCYTQNVQWQTIGSFVVCNSY